MNRIDWLKQQRQILEEHEDRIYSPIYDEHWGAIDPPHARFYTRFLQLCRSEGVILDAACGTGKYWPLILASGRSVYGIDQSRGMLEQALAKFPGVPVQKVGMQEMDFQEAFDGVACIDAMEMIFPEDWPLVLGNIYRAVKPEGCFYFTVELASAQDLAPAFARGRQVGMPVVYGEWSEEGDHGVWAQEGFYHYYPALEQVKEGVEKGGFHLIDEAGEGEYHHLIVQKPGE